MACLDSDSISDSQTLLDQSKSLDSSSPELDRLQKAIVARREPAKFSLDQLTAERMPWLFLLSGNFSDSFLKRQRFKIYAACRPVTSDRSAWRLHLRPMVWLQNGKRVLWAPEICYAGKEWSQHY